MGLGPVSMESTHWATPGRAAAQQDRVRQVRAGTQAFPRLPLGSSHTEPPVSQLQKEGPRVPAERPGDHQACL